MAPKSKSPKKLRPQPLPEDEPSHDWPLERLGEYAKGQYSQIVERERMLSPCYWKLGQALSIARKNFAHGQWAGYLESLEIDKTRASKACAIFRAFSTPEAVAMLSVEDAYEARRPAPARESEFEITDGGSPQFNGALTKIEKLVERTFIDQAALSAEEKQELLETIRRTIDTLQAYASRLEDELKTAGDDKEPK